MSEKYKNYFNEKQRRYLSIKIVCKEKYYC